MLLWNCRGWGWPDFANQFNFLCCLNVLDVFFIVELKSGLDSGLGALMSKRFSKMFFAISDGKARGLCLCWNDININLNVIAHSSRFIHCEVTEKVLRIISYLHVYMHIPKRIFNLNCGMKLLI